MNGKQAKRLRRLARMSGDPKAPMQAKITRYKTDKPVFNKRGEHMEDEKGQKLFETFDMTSLAHGAGSPRRLYTGSKAQWDRLTVEQRRKIAREADEIYKRTHGGAKSLPEVIAEDMARGAPTEEKQA